MEKVKYEFDPYHRLTVTGDSLRASRKVIDGQFKISGQNTLAYHIKTPVPQGLKAPHQLKLKGIWSLTKDHQLRLTLDQLSRQTFGDQLTLQGDILDARKNSLLFAVTTRTRADMPSIYILELSGSWQADKHNRLTFRLNKENGRFDTLVFDGTWQIDENYQITYQCQKQRLKRKSKEAKALIFKGHWDIKDKALLSYVLSNNPASGFEFNTGYGIFKDDYIKYELGIGLSRKKQPVKRIIVFFGKWKLKKNSGLVFEIDTAGRKIQEIVFGAEVKLSDKDTASFNLRNSKNREIAVKLELSREIFSGNGQAFLRLLKSRQESAILAGAGWRW